MRHKPTFNYCGLTIVLSFPSRKDEKQLLSGAAGFWFNEECLMPACNRWQCDVRTADTLGEGILPNTKAILLFGEKAFHEWSSENYRTYTLNEQRGYLLDNRWRLPMLATFSPQDCMDPVNYERRYNEQLKDYEEEFEEDEDEEEYTGKRHGRTARSNYRFWTQQDTVRITCKGSINRSARSRNQLAQVLLRDEQQKLSTSSIIPYPNLEDAINYLRSAKDSILYLDIETDISADLQKLILCIGFSIDSGPVYVVPLVRYNYTLAYGGIERFLQALAYAMTHNTVVVHNTMFDLVVLAWKYKIPVGRNIYDTMLAQHKLFSGVEKSLGHCMSLLTWLPFHKDEGINPPRNTEQEQQLWQYNGKDIIGMRAVHRAQVSYASSNPGLQSSIDLANKCVYPYLINTLYGMHYNQEKLNAYITENDKLMTQYLRIINLLLGEDLVRKIAGPKSKAPLCSSPKQCVRYFHDMLGYPVVKSSKTTGLPSLDADAIYKLKLKSPVDNPVLDLVLRFREVQKETGSLKFIPWKTQQIQQNETIQ